MTGELSALTPSLPGLEEKKRRVRSLSALAREVGVSRALLDRLLYEADAPRKDAGGFWDVGEVLEFVEARRGGGLARVNPKLERLKEEIEGARLRALLWQEQKRNNAFVPIGEHVEVLTLVLNAVSSVFVSVPQSVALITPDAEIRSKVSAVIGEAERQCKERLRVAVEAAKEAGEAVGT